MLLLILQEIKTEADPVNQEILMQRYSFIKGVEREISKFLGSVILKVAMASHNDLGRRGEDIAKEYLENIGYRVLRMNWKCGKAEVDVIASYRIPWYL